MEDTKIAAKIENQKSGSSFCMIDTCLAFGPEFLDESACRSWILNSLHKGSVVGCPECGSELGGSYPQRFWDGKRIRCCNCGKFYTALTGTVLSGCHLDYRSIMLLAVFLFFGVRPDFIAKKLDITTETIRLWRKKFEAIDRINTIDRDQSYTGGCVHGN